MTRKSKFDKFCDGCGALCESKKGIEKEYFVRNIGDEKNPIRKRLCKTCDERLKGIYQK